MLFQNGEGNINAGVFFNDPDVDLEELSWFNIMAAQMWQSFQKNEGLVYRDEEFDTLSCYVELHR